MYLSTKIDSGKYNSTPKGTFSVLKKVRDTTLSGSNYIVKVKYWIAFKGNKYGLHDAPWRDSFGDLNYYYNGSHGCINTPDDAMEKLYNRVEIGTPIYISD